MKRICVYCGSSPGKRPEYIEAAQVLGQALVKRGIGLVYGGASVGVMGKIADSVLAGGGEAIGIIPEALSRKEVFHDGLTKLHVVGSMHERKTMMEELSDGFIALPGGLGTLEEIFEVLTWSQLGFHQKPCGMLNVDGYYDGLLAFLSNSVEQEFVKPVHREMLLVETSPEPLLELMDAYQPPVVEKWIGRDDN